MLIRIGCELLYDCPQPTPMLLTLNVHFTRASDMVVADHLVTSPSVPIRDYTHLAVAFCRCMNIPARYCTGYLGDIGVPVSDAPMDFAAWFEAYLGGAWHTFDARNNTPRIGRVLIARGRDAADVAITTTFGPNTLSSFTVVTEEVAAVG